MFHAVQLTERDRRLLQMVATYRAVTIAQLRRRFFATPGARSACYARIKRLISAHYLSAQRLGSVSGIGSGKMLLTLGRAGRRLVTAAQNDTRHRLGRTPRLRTLGTLAHHLAIGDLRLSFELAVEQSRRFRRMAWRPEHELASAPIRLPDPESGQTFTWIPDGALQLELHDGRTQSFLVELDRGTIPGKRLRPKLRAYLRQVPPLPVLFVVPDAHRQATILAWTRTEAERLGTDPTLIWLTTSAQVTETTVLERLIWQVVGGPVAWALTALVDGHDGRTAQHAPADLDHDPQHPTGGPA